MNGRNQMNKTKVLKALELYRKFLAISIHFKSSNFNAASYGLMTACSVETFLAKDKRVVNSWMMLLERLKYAKVNPESYLYWCNAIDHNQRPTDSTVHNFNRYKEWYAMWGTKPSADKKSFHELTKLADENRKNGVKYDRGYPYDVDDTGSLLIFLDYMDEKISLESVIIWSLNNGIMEHWYSKSDHMVNSTIYHKVHKHREILMYLWGLR